MYKPVNNYLENQVLNASPVELIIMLYNKAIFSLKSACNLMEAGANDPESVKKKAQAFGKAVEIISYLQACLNHEKGKEIAKNLKEIYQVLLDELVRAQAVNDVEVVKKSIEILEDLKKAWEDIKVVSAPAVNERVVNKGTDLPKEAYAGA
jgi:flagellar protein FliS